MDERQFFQGIETPPVSNLDKPDGPSCAFPVDVSNVDAIFWIPEQKERERERGERGTRLGKLGSRSSRISLTTARSFLRWFPRLRISLEKAKRSFVTTLTNASLTRSRITPSPRGRNPARLFQAKSYDQRPAHHTAEISSKGSCGGRLPVRPRA